MKVVRKTEYDYFIEKVPNRTYLSKRIDSKEYVVVDEKLNEIIVPLRIASKVIDSPKFYKFMKVHDNIILRTTEGGRQEIKATIFEESKDIKVLQIQRFTTNTGTPHNTHFSFIGSEIKSLSNFINNIPELPLSSTSSVKIDDDELEQLKVDKHQAYKLYIENKEIFDEILIKEISSSEISNLVYRKSQLEIFEKMLTTPEFFNSEKMRLSKTKDEDLWQWFFEQNVWIFGYGLQFIINTPLEGKKLEQVVQGYDIITKGKRVDAVLKTKGVINSLCFTEIKKHNTRLLKEQYRPACYPPSDELAGGVSQIQKTVQKSVENLTTKIEPVDTDGYPTGEQIFLYKPKSFLVVGTLQEFVSSIGINQEKFSSFELYRRSLKDIEIITYDELLERAKYIVRSNEDLEKYKH